MVCISIRGQCWELFEDQVPSTCEVMSANYSTACGCTSLGGSSIFNHCNKNRWRLCDGDICRGCSQWVDYGVCQSLFLDENGHEMTIKRGWIQSMLDWVNGITVSAKMEASNCL